MVWVLRETGKGRGKDGGEGPSRKTGPLVTDPREDPWTHWVLMSGGVTPSSSPAGGGQGRSSSLHRPNRVHESYAGLGRPVDVGGVQRISGRCPSKGVERTE